MLIKRVILDRIVAGEVDLIFRRWRKPELTISHSPGYALSPRGLALLAIFDA